MFGKSVTLFRLFGFAVRADVTWVFLLILITWSLAVRAFPDLHPGLEPPVYWMMGVAGTILLFLSIVLHEFSHAMVARRFGIPIKGITLFIFGGVAEMSEEPPNPRSELLMAAAGPATSVLIAALCLGLGYAGGPLGWASEVVAVFQYLFWVNLVLVVFNLVPAFPMDGGRILRATLWAWRGDLRAATRTASEAGSFFGMVLIALGIVGLVSGNFMSGLWWFVIGMFVRNIAQSSYQQLLMRQFLEGVPISRFMTTEIISVPRSIPVSELVEQYVYRYHHKMFPVKDGDRLLGCVTTQKVRELARESWDQQTVGAITEPCSAENTTAPDADAMTVLGKMSSSGRSRLLVVDNGTLIGLITLKDLVAFLSVHLELGGEE